jgi:hypothetical protein
MDFEPETLNALIGTGGVIGGAIIGCAVAAYNVRHKIKEIEIRHSHQLHENYLKNAREYLESVYVPISVELANLQRAYFTFRGSLALGRIELEAMEAFSEATLVYTQKIDELFAKGAGAFLTTELESKLLEFGSFIGQSGLAKEVLRKVVVEYGISLFGMNTYHMQDIKVSGSKADFWQGKFGFSQLGVSVKFNGELILAAPMNSRDFEETFSYYISVLMLLIKEVTLGTRPE